jgi:hypothetical protein
MSQLSFEAEMIRFDYVLHGFTVLKLIVMMAITLGWVYGSRWNEYDVFLLLRSSPWKVHLSRAVVLWEMSLLLAFGLYALFVTGWLCLPYAIDVRLFVTMGISLAMFTWYYQAMALLFERMLRHPAGLFVPLFGYVVSLLFQDATVEPNAPLDPAALPQLLWPELIWEHGFRFGGWMVVAVGLIWLQVSWRVIQRQDAI